MRKLIAITLLIVAFSCSTLYGTENSLLNQPIKKLYDNPTEKANLVYEIPIEVALLDVSPDANWYKVKIAFNIGPFGYSYTGWTKISVGDLLAQREKDAKTKVAQKELIKP